MSTTTTTTTTTSTPPSPPTSPLRKPKPTLTLNPTLASAPSTSAAPASTSYYDSPDSLRSCFSPCSSDSESESDSDSEESEAPAPPRGRHFQRLWASREPPSMPPSGPPPAIPRRLASFSSVSSGSTSRRPSRLGSMQADQPFVFSPGPNTPWAAPYGCMPSAPTAPSTPYSPWSTAPLPVRVDTALLGLEARLMAVLGGQPPEELAAARRERDVLFARAQRAYIRREEVGGVRWELEAVDAKVKALEAGWMAGVLRSVEGVVKDMARDVAPREEEEEREEEVEEAREEKEEDEGFDEEDIIEVLDHAVVEPKETEEEVPQLQVPPNEERRFTWIPSSSFDSDSEDSGSEADSEYDGYDSDDERLAVPALLHNHSASSSEASSSPIIPSDNGDWTFSLVPAGQKYVADVMVVQVAGVEMAMI